MAEGKKKRLSLSLKRKIVVSDEEEIENASGTEEHPEGYRLGCRSIQAMAGTSQCGC